MSLSFFLRDYLYIPLGGNRVGSGREALNIMTTMGLGGLWHGAGINFVIWGLLHGCYVNIAHFGARLLRPGSPAAALCGVATFIAVLVGWAFFRADSFPGALIMICGLLGQSGRWAASQAPMHRLFREPTQALLLSYCACHCLCLPSTRVLFSDYILAGAGERPHASHIKWSPSLLWAGFSAALFSAAVWLMLDENKREFIYFQF
jgi:D-alanyl-lipoteichoic acid acyltransferase DltB (MBOAT superfamily)